jgi:hypothetical protein
MFFANECDITARYMKQDVAHSRGGCNSRRTLKVSGQMTSMVQLYIEDGSLVLGFRMLSAAPEWMDVLSRALEWMDP